jgi:hypothetical protein
MNNFYIRTLMIIPIRYILRIVLCAEIIEKKYSKLIKRLSIVKSIKKRRMFITQSKNDPWMMVLLQLFAYCRRR